MFITIQNGYFVNILINTDSFNCYVVGTLSVIRKYDNRLTLIKINQDINTLKYVHNRYINQLIRYKS